MDDRVTNAHLLAAISRIDAKLDGKIELVLAEITNTNRRVDEKVSEIIRHLDRHEGQIDGVAKLAREAKELANAANHKAEEALGGAARKGLIIGGGASAMVAGAIEGIRVLLGGMGH